MNKKYKNLKLNILKITNCCRGHQTIGVHFNCKLIQHMHHETNDVEKDQYSSVHDMEFTHEFTTILNFTRESKVPVNSRHHQVIDPKTLPKELKILAIHRSFNNKNLNAGNSDGSVEMIAHTELPIVGIQSHVEDYLNYESISFVNNIVEHLITKKTSILK